MRMSDFLTANDRQHLAGLGPVARVESLLEQFYGVEHALAVCNATQGLMAVATVLGLRGTEVIGPDLTWAGSYAGLLFQQVRLRLAKVDSQTLTVCPSSIRSSLTPATRAIVSVDYLGIPADGEALRTLADEHELLWIADAASSLGALRNGSPASASADVWVVSFGFGKGITAGGGGAILTNHVDLYEKLLWLTQHPDRQRRELRRITNETLIEVDNELALNLVMHPLAAQMIAETFDEQLATLRRRQEQGAHLSEVLGETDLVVPLPISDDEITPSYPMIVGMWKGRKNTYRLKQALHQQGISARIGPVPGRFMQTLPAFRAKYPAPLQRQSIDLSRYLTITWDEENFSCFSAAGIRSKRRGNKH